MKIELEAMEAQRQASKRELEKDLEEAHRGAKQRTPSARNLARNIFPTPTPKQKKKAVRKESPVHTPSPAPPPLVLSSKPDSTAW